MMTIYKFIKFITNSLAGVSNLDRIILLQIYTIEVRLGECQWTVQHRYSEFHELHEKVNKITNDASQPHECQ